MRRGFGSDNNASVHPDVLAAISRANADHARGYGDEDWTREAESSFRRVFGEECRAFFVFNGTGGNVVGLQAMLRPYEAVICSESAHIHQDECGAPERMIGCKLIAVPAPDGKLSPASIELHLKAIGVVHHAQPRVVSITQATELGTVYAPSELRAISEVAHANGMLVHVDGARFANAAAGLKIPIPDQIAGIDVMTFGGTKNGLMVGEAVLVFDPEIASRLEFVRKQSAQLASKMRFISAQFMSLLAGELWLANAGHANAMAQRLASRVRDMPGVRITHPVEANSVFAVIPREAVGPLQAEFFFYMWDESRSEARWVCSFDTTPEDVELFADALRRHVMTG